jgi:Flp pilus assembly protein TadG
MTPLSVLRLRPAPRRWRRGVVAWFMRRQGGSAAVEFALVSAPVIALTLAILQVGLIYFAQEALESAVEETARLVLTGQVQATSTTPALTAPQFKQQLCNNSSGLFTCNNFMIDLQPASSFANVDVSKPTITYDPVTGQPNNTWQYNAGAPGDIMVMRVMYPWPVFLGPLALNFGNMQNNNLLLMSSSVFRNEP